MFTYDDDNSEISNSFTCKINVNSTTQLISHKSIGVKLIPGVLKSLKIRALIRVNIIKDDVIVLYPTGLYVPSLMLRRPADRFPY